MRILWGIAIILVMSSCKKNDFSGTTNNQQPATGVNVGSAPTVQTTNTFDVEPEPNNLAVDPVEVNPDLTSIGDIGGQGDDDGRGDLIEVPPTDTGGGSSSIKPLHINRICRELNGPQRGITGIRLKFFNPTTGAPVSFESPASPSSILASINSDDKKIPDNAFQGLPDGDYFVMMCNTRLGLNCGEPKESIPQIVLQYNLYTRDLETTESDPLHLMNSVAVIAADDPRVGVIPVLQVRSGMPVVPAKSGKTSSGIRSTVTELGVIFDPDSKLLFGNCVHSPLMANFAGEEIILSSPKNGIQFDISAKGVKNKVSWPTQATTGVLVRDLNKNGNIDDAHELFGNLTKLPDGTYAKNGFEALKPYDSNSDGFVAANDKLFNELKFWFDKNRNGMSEKGELVPVSDKGIVGFITDYTIEEKKDNHGNVFRELSLMQNSQGLFSPIYDVWLMKE